MDIKGTIETLGVGKDKGQYNNLEALLDYLKESKVNLEQAINQVLPDGWQEEITTKEFGTRTKAQAIGRITSHTAYHAGQIGIILKYGSK